MLGNAFWIPVKPSASAPHVLPLPHWVCCNLYIWKVHIPAYLLISEVVECFIIENLFELIRGDFSGFWFMQAFIFI